MTTKENTMQVGTRVRLLQDVDRYPHFIAPKGATGEVIEVDRLGNTIVQMHDYLKGADDWDNCIWFGNGLGDPAEDLEIIA